MSDHFRTYGAKTPPPPLLLIKFKMVGKRRVGVEFPECGCRIPKGFSHLEKKTIPPFIILFYLKNKMVGVLCSLNTLK